jgi:hypothetical protein
LAHCWRGSESSVAGPGRAGQCRECGAGLLGLRQQLTGISQQFAKVGLCEVTGVAQ